MNKIVINQNKDKFYNSDAILFVNIDSGGITLHTRNVEIDFGRYEHDTRKRKAFEMLQDFLSGRFTMPTEKELEYIDDISYTCQECGCKNKIPAETYLKIVNYNIDRSCSSVYCSVCGNKTLANRIQLYK